MFDNLFNKIRSYNAETFLIDGEEIISYQDLLNYISKFEDFYKNSSFTKTRKNFKFIF